MAGPSDASPPAADDTPPSTDAPTPTPAPTETEARPPPSIASTEATLAAERGTSASPARVTGKRRRDDDDATGDEPEARPATRPRTAGYEAPAGLWSWLATPLKIFANGFRQGAGLSAAPAADSARPAAPA
jgi:hypothetical protein